MKQIFLAVFYCLLFCCSVLSKAQDNVVTPHHDPALRFTENKGQWDPFVRYRVQLDGGALYMEDNGLTYNFYDKKKYRSFHMGGMAKEKDPKIKAHAFKVEFLNCNTNFANESLELGEDYENYYLGSDKSKWKSNVRNYHRIWYRNIYNGIDYESVTTTKGLKYNFHVKAGFSPDVIQLKYTGADKLKLSGGELIVSTCIGEMKEKKPYAYQMIKGKTVEVPCRFSLKNNTVSFEFPKGYNTSYDLVIDPILVFAAQSGSTADNFGMTATYDLGGNLYTGGTVFNNGYPTTTGAYDVSFSGPAAGGNTDVVVTKYSPTGTSLVFSTYLGGSGSEIVTSLIVDAANNLFLYGATGSANFPMLSNSFDNSFNGGSAISFVFNGTNFAGGTDIYVAKFNSTGTALTGATYLGGSDNDGVNYNNVITTYTTPYGPITEYPPDSLQTNYGDQYRGEIQLDRNGNVYIASSTKSSNFPMVGGFDNTLGGKQDAVVVKLTPSLNNIVWSSFLGGSGNDAGYSLVVTDSLFTYVTGGTYSTNFPVTTGAYDATYNGGKCDGYIAKINPAGNTILKATYLGTNDYDQSYFVQADKQSNIYVYGQSLGNMPIVGTVFSVANSHQFISKLDNQLTNLTVSTVFGSGANKLDISPSAFSVDNCGNIYISGWGGNIIFGPPNAGMPVTAGAFQTTPPNGYDFYLMVLAPNMGSLLYGTHFGGGMSAEHVDGGTSRFDKRGIIYQSVCAGCGGNDDFPVTPGAWPNSPPGGPNLSSNCNNGVFKFDFQIKITNVTINTNTIQGCAPLTVNFTNPSYGGGTFTWNFGAGDTTSTILNPVKTFTNPGTYTVSLVVVDSTSCNKVDSSVTYINVYPSIAANATATFVSCTDSVKFSGNGVTTGTLTNLQWTFGGGSISTSTITNPANTYSTSGTYTAQLLVVNNFGCRDSVTIPVNVNLFSPGVASGGTICEGFSTGISASGGNSYSWQPGASLSNSLIANPTASPTTTTIYSVTVSNTVTGCSRTLTTQVNVNPKMNPGFTFTVVECTDSVAFTNTSTTAAASHTVQWYFGDGTGTTTVNPVHHYSSTGTYTVSLITTNNFGCSDSIKQPVSIFIFNPSVVPPAVICEGKSVSLNAGGGTSYTWQPSSMVTNSTIANPSTSPTATTVYSVTVFNNTFGQNCSSTLTTQVTVNPKPNADYTYSINPCGGGVYFNDLSASNINTWYWDFGNAQSSVGQNPYHFYFTGGTYSITLYVSNIYGCLDTIVKSVLVPSPPPLSVNSNTMICYGDSVQLNATGGLYYSWMPGSSLTNSLIANPIAFPTASTDYSVNITTTNVIGDTCKFLLTTQVNVTQVSALPMSVTADPDTVIKGNSSTLSLNASPGATAIWFPNNSTTPAIGYVVGTTPPKTTTYTVEVSKGGCKEILTVTVVVLEDGCYESDIFVPNTFTPNGDGYNDIMYVRGFKVQEIFFAIYNRWGEKVFETNDRSIGWDGLHKGRPADVGVFGYYVKVKCYNGEETFKKGNITLIR